MNEGGGDRVTVFSATFNNISAISWRGGRLMNVDQKLFIGEISME